MKKPICVALLIAAVSAVPAPAQTAKADNAGVEEHSRLVQAYMARRAEWVALREREQKRARDAKDDQERKRILRKLDDDEHALRAASATLARQVHEAEQARRPDAKPRG